jgi:hypothetical protein
MQSSSANEIPPPTVKGQELLALYFSSSSRLGDKSNLESILQRGLSLAPPCRKCRGTGIGNYQAIQAWKAKRAAWESEHPELDYSKVKPEPLPTGDCSRCDGFGYLARKISYEEVTVRPTGGSQGGATLREPDGGMLNIAKASRVMVSVERADVAHWRALVAYHGDVGEYAAGKHGNRLLAVAMLVPASVAAIERELAKRNRKRLEEASERRRKALRSPELRWRFSDGTRVTIGGQIHGDSKLAKALAPALGGLGKHTLATPEILDSFLR